MEYQVLINGEPIADSLQGELIELSATLTLGEYYNSFSFVASHAIPTSEIRDKLLTSKIEILFDKRSVIVGYVDTANLSWDTTAGISIVNVAGKSVTSDLIGTISSRLNWRTAVNLPTIVETVCSDFNQAKPDTTRLQAFKDFFVTGTSDTIDPLKQFPRFISAPGETAIDLIARAATQRASFVYSIGDKLIVANTWLNPVEGAREIATELANDNINSIDVTFDYSGLYTSYNMTSSLRPTENSWGKSNRTPFYVRDAQFAGTGRVKPYWIQREAGDKRDNRTLAYYEMLERTRNDAKFKIDLAQAQLIYPNTYIDVNLGNDKNKLYVKQVTYQISASEQTCSVDTIFNHTSSVTTESILSGFDEWKRRQ